VASTALAWHAASGVQCVGWAVGHAVQVPTRASLHAAFTSRRAALAAPLTWRKHHQQHDNQRQPGRLQCTPRHVEARSTFARDLEALFKYTACQLTRPREESTNR
jgi:hypothetical protein